MRTEEEIREALEKFDSIEFDYGVFGLNDTSRGFKQCLKWVLNDYECKEDAICCISEAENGTRK